MNFINKESVLTNKQLWAYIKLLGDDVYKPRQIIICESRVAVFKNFFKSVQLLFNIISILKSKIEGVYDPIFDKAIVFTFAQDFEEYDDIDKQLYSLHALTHELRHRFQIIKRMKISEEDADNFATNFINKNSGNIRKIMKWKDEYEVEEE
jgi:hypothetical protein